MSDTVVMSENILDIVLWVKNLRWQPFVQGQAINSYHFQNNMSNFFFVCVYHGASRYAVHSGVVIKYFRHSIVGETFKMATICSKSSNKLISFST